VQIEPGWWSHERYEQYVERYQLTALDLLILRPQAFEDKEVPKPELIERLVEGAYLLDQIILSWKGDAFELQGFDEEGYRKIRVHRDDIEKHFGIREGELQSTEAGSLPDIGTSSERLQLPEADVDKKRKTKPDPLRSAVRAWLENVRREKGPDWIKVKSNPWLVGQYHRSGEQPQGHRDAVRKIITAWRQDHGLSRPTRPKS
jgi:hypothetical protein